MDNPETQETLGTRNRTKTNKTKNTTQKTKIVSNMALVIKKKVTQGPSKGKQFLFLIRYPPCYSYTMKSIPAKVLL